MIEKQPMAASIASMSSVQVNQSDHPSLLILEAGSVSLGATFALKDTDLVAPLAGTNLAAKRAGQQPVQREQMCCSRGEKIDHAAISHFLMQAQGSQVQVLRYMGHWNILPY